MPSTSPSAGRPDAARPSRYRRPTGSTLEAIERDGISWEGEVAIGGHGSEIPAYFMVTSDRIVLANGNLTMLEAPRTWLVPAPISVDDHGVRLSITPDGVMPSRDTTERLLLTVRDGHGPANQLLAILTGRTRRERIDAELPAWKPGVGAGRSSALPPLPAFETAQDAPATRAARATGDAETRGGPPISRWEPPHDDAPAPDPQGPDPDTIAPRSHAARFLASREPVTAAPPQKTKPQRKQAATLAPVPSEQADRHRSPAAWLGWAALLTIVVLAGSWFARPYLPDDVTDRLPAALMGNDAGDDGTIAMQPETAQPSSPTFGQGDGTTGADSDPAHIMPTEVALGVGGVTADSADGAGGGEHGPEGSVLPTPTPPAATGDDEESLPGAPNTQPASTGDQGGTTSEQPADTGDTQPEPTQPPVVIETETPTEPATEIPTEAPTEAPATEIPTEAPTEAPATEIPTETPTEEPATTPTEESPATPTAAPTESPEPTIAPTDEAVTEPTLEPQAPSVNPEEPPAQEFVDSGIRYSVEGASSGASVPELPEINAVTYGEWIVLSVDGQNLTGENQVFDMREFTLIADGETIQVDVGNSWVASMLGYSPAYSNTDAILWAPGEQHQFALTFLAPLGAQSLILQAGDQQLDLGGILETTPALGQMRQGAAPETIDARVVDVLDGETILIEKDGIQQTVRYLGIDVPTGDACYAADATEANRQMVSGQVVKIERQATDVDAQGNWVRDVWVQTDDGRYALVAHQLVQEGAAMADISEPNTRFASWLRSADAAAHAEGRGLWGACGQGSTTDTGTIASQAADTPRRAVIT